MAILHVDLNCFYASCAVLDSGGKYTADTPLVVAGDPKQRQGIILAATYPVKRLGVYAGMPLGKALELCPQAVVAEPTYRRYMELSDRFVRILSDYTPMIMRYGIDEAYLDYGGCEHLFGTPADAAHAVRERVKRELGLTVSVGVGNNMLKAKMGSDYQKPDAVTELDEYGWREKIWPLPVERLMYVGRATGRKLRAMGIANIERLAKTPLTLLQQSFGVMGRALWMHANGMDDTKITSEPEPQKGIGHSMTLREDFLLPEQICRALLYQTERVAYRLRSAGVRARVVSVHVRFSDLTGRSGQATLERPTDLTDELYAAAKPLMLRLCGGRAVRQVGVQTGRLTRDTEQLSFFDGPEREKLRRMDAAVDAVRTRYGAHAVARAGTLQFEYNEKEDFTPFLRH